MIAKSTFSKDNQYKKVNKNKKNKIHNISPVCTLDLKST